MYISEQITISHTDFLGLVKVKRSEIPNIDEKTRISDSKSEELILVDACSEFLILLFGGRAEFWWTIP